MANTPKKMKDPTEAALSAIQDALNVRDPEPGTQEAATSPASGAVPPEFAAEPEPQWASSRPGASAAQDFDDEVRDGELQLMHPEPLGLILWRKAQPRPEPVQDQCGLRNDGLSGFEDRRREGRMLPALALDERDVALTALLPRDIDIVGTGFF